MVVVRLAVSAVTVLTVPVLSAVVIEDDSADAVVDGAVRVAVVEVVTVAVAVALAGVADACLSVCSVRSAAVLCVAVHLVYVDVLWLYAVLRCVLSI